ncbi:MAG: response regulator [Bacteroidales bacterium]|nr:response regulator [Bacteroidales bacterium]
MPYSQPYLNTLGLDFGDTSFDKLMQKRIHKILLICSSYDAFMLEEDGRIDEQIFNEYVSLSLRYPPTFIQAHSSREVLTILQEEKIDLIISMLNISDMDAFNLARLLKSRYPEIPIVVLTPYSKDVSLRLQKEDLSAVDYVFCWLGNADILLAIIKLIEDKMNAEYDLQHIGVQAIILVEDSVRYYSVFLPNIYKIIFRQSKSFMKEALNEHQRMLRLRGRPKILLATNFEEAKSFYDKYKANILGIISDINYKIDNKRNSESMAGLLLCKQVKEEDPYMPFILQSSDISNKSYADEMGVGFIYKNSKTLNIELRDYIISQFGFGDFIFRDPKTMKEICRATDLQHLQQQILNVPDDSFQYHTSQNHISKWLNARALFSIAQLCKPLTVNDFRSISELRKFIYQSISSYRLSKGRGIIAKFDRNSFDEYSFFSRIGEESIGGKARGLAFINSIIKDNKLFEKFENVIISIPRTVVISTEFFDEFMEDNKLYKVALSDLPDKDILNRFLEANLPERLKVDLKTIASSMKNSLAIRSSSKLEDSHYQPFAGIYSTYMVPLVEDVDTMHRMICQAIKSVYASVYFRSSKAYMAATSNVIDEEKMGIVIQEICGNRRGDIFFPTFSGVARSINFYPIGSEKAHDGIATVGYGLGKLIVDGGGALRFSPKYPKKILQLSSPEMALRQTQKQFYALDMRPESFVPSVDDGVNILKFDIKEAINYPDFCHVVSTYDYHNQTLRDGFYEGGTKLVTFSSILKHKTFPLAEIIQTLLEIGQKEMNNPIEIEFAVNLDTPPGWPKIFNFLQIRPIVENEQTEEFLWSDIDCEKALLFSRSALGHGVINNITDFVYVKPEKFNPSHTQEIAKEVEAVNQKYIDLKRNYVLVGPGRWGSSDPWLGIPIKWSQISEARVIVESGLDNFKVDPSQGTHFFQNLTSFRVGYLTINPYINDGKYDVAFLNSQKSFFETEHLRCIKFDKHLVIQIDGKSNKGVIFKPEKVSEN